MKFIRRLAVICLALLFAALLTAAETWKVTTWNLEWFPSGKPDFTDAAVEAERTTAAAKVLRDLDPDIILLQEVRDEAAVEALAKQIGRGHKVAVVSRFKFGSKIGTQQQAILAKQSATAAYWKEWTTRQLVNPPRGYAFATLKTKSGKTVAIYSLHLKSNVLSRSAKTDEERAKSAISNRLQRELAASQTIEHLRDISGIAETRPMAVVVGGDFNTDPMDAKFTDESTLKAFLSAGFEAPALKLPLAQRATLPAKGKYTAVTFDHLLLRGVKTKSTPFVTLNTVSDHRPVTIVIEVP